MTTHDDAGAPRSPRLKERHGEFVANGERARRLAGPLSARQLWWRPGRGRWSVGECLEHLVLAGEAYLGEIDPAVAQARADGLVGDGPPRRSVFGRLLVRGVEPPARVRIPAPRSIRPRRPAPGALERFLELRARIARRLRAADGLDLGRVRVGSPFVPLVTVDLHTALRIMAGHERRHLHQAQEVRADPDFPADDAAPAGRGREAAG